MWAVYFTDEHRIVLKPLVHRTWAPIGQPPLAVVEYCVCCQ
ncbi:MAG: hypothetical protein ACXVCO_12330 [Ktedonobacterales bacterium]